MSKRLARLFGVAEEETKRVVLMFAALFFLIAAHTTTKVVRDSVFLAAFGLTELSYTMVALVVVAGVAVSAYSRWTARIARHKVIWGLHLVVALSLCAVTIALRTPNRFLPIGFYIWSGLFGLVVLTEFWLLANDLFHAREAKRLFAVVGSGGILGGIFGGLSTSWLAGPIGTRNLLLLAAAEMMIAAALSHAAWMVRSRSEAPAEARPRFKFVDELQLLRKSGYARLIAITTLCLTVAVTLAEWQYQGFTKAHFASHRDEMARFFGILAVFVGALAFVLQLLGTSKLLKRFSAPGVLNALPAACAIGAMMVLGTLVLPVPAIFAAAAAMMLVDGLQFTVNKAASELLYVPLEADVRAATKRFIETVVDRFAGALAAILWLLLTWSFQINRPDRLPYVSLLILVIVAGWLIALARVRPAYLDAFRAVIGAEAAPVAMAIEAPDPIRRRQQARVRSLLGQLEVSARKRTRILRSLAPIQHAAGTLGFEWQDIERHVKKEVQMVATLQQAFELTNLGERRTVLRRTIDDRLSRAIERVARLLALVYPPKDIAAVHRALQGPSVRVRAGALELLESMIDGESKAELLQVLEAQTLGTPRLSPISRVDGLRLLFAVDDAWLRASAAWAAADCGALCADLERLSISDPSRAVRAAAVISLRSARRQIPEMSEAVVDLKGVNHHVE